MGDFREHGILLYLSPSLYMAFIKLQGDKGLGRSFAGLLAFNEGMHNLKYVTDEDYEVNKLKYSRKLLEKEVPQKPLTSQQVTVKKEHDEMSRAFSGVLSQWNMTHNDPHWKEKWIKKAEVWKDKIPSASMIIDLKNQGKNSVSELVL
jgi:hypothetical protein